MAGTVEGGGYRGREGIEAYFAEYGEAWEEQRLLAEKFRDLGDRVLVLGRTEGRGRGGGVPVDPQTETIFDLRDGKVSRVGAYLDHGEALRAAGLSEQAAELGVGSVGLRGRRYRLLS